MKIKLNIPLSLSKIKKITGASGEISEREIEYIATDSREASENTLFIALPGEKYDGEDFVGEAEALGAAPLSKARGLKVDVYCVFCG